MSARDKEILRLYVDLRKERDALMNEIQTLKPDVIKILRSEQSVICNGFLIERRPGKCSTPEGVALIPMPAKSRSTFGVNDITDEKAR